MPALCARALVAFAVIPVAANSPARLGPTVRPAIVTTAAGSPVTKINSCTLPALTAALAVGGTIEFECSGTILIRKTLNIAGHVSLIGGNNNVILAPYDNTTTGRLLNVENSAVYTQNNVQMQGAYIAGKYESDAPDGSSGASGQNGTNGSPGMAGKPGGPAPNGANASENGGAAIFVAAGAKATVEDSVFTDDVVQGDGGGSGGWGGDGGGGGEGSTDGGTVDKPIFGASGTSGGAGADGGPAGNGGKGGEAQGGAIQNLGTLTLSFDTFENNAATGGAGGLGGNGGIAGEGGDGSGGTAGQKNDKGDYISAGGNGGDAGQSGHLGGIGGHGGVGGVGEGGAVFNEGTLTVDGGSFMNNSVTGGAAGWGGWGAGAFSGCCGSGSDSTESGGLGADGSPDGKGGTGANGGDANISGVGGAGAAGLGGAIYNEGNLDVCSAQFQNDSAYGGAGGGGGAGGYGANGGNGGLNPADSSSGPAGNGGAGSNGGTGGVGGAASGGAVYSKDAVSTHGATFSGDSETGGSGGSGGVFGPGGQPGFGTGASEGTNGAAGPDGKKGSTSGLNAGGSVTVGAGPGASCPLVSDLSVHSAPVNGTGSLTIYGAGFTGATKIEWECLNGAQGMYISKPGQFKVLNAAGTAISVPVLPGPVDPLLAQNAKACGFSLDDSTFPFDIIVWVGAHHSPAVVADRFDYLGPHVDGLSLDNASVGQAPQPLTITGTNLDAVTKVLFACLGQTTHGFSYGPSGFKVNGAGTQISMSTTPTAWTYIATSMAKCNEPLDQDSYNFHIILYVGQVYSHGDADSLFTYFGPKIESMNLHQLKIASTKKLTIVGENFESASAVEWDCSSGVHGFRVPVTAADVSTDGTSLSVTTPSGVSSSINSVATACGFGSNQQSFKFDVRVVIGSLYSARDSAADSFTYTR